MKNMEREAFPAKPKQQYHVSNDENVFMIPNHEEKGD